MPCAEARPAPRRTKARAGYGHGTDSAGTSGGSVSNDSISNVVLTSGTNVTGVVFAETEASDHRPVVAEIKPEPR